jgi:hypothetical protein
MEYLKSINLKGIKIILILIVMAFTAAAQKKENFLIGSWKIVKRISTDPHFPLNKEESNQFIGDIIIFKPDSIIAPINNYFLGPCALPNYKFKIVNAMKFFGNDRAYLKVIGCKTTNIEVVETTCGVPFAYIYKNNNDEINIGADGYTYFLRKIK